MKVFTAVFDWFSGLMKRFRGGANLVDALEQVELVTQKALPIVEWVGDVVDRAIKSSHLPVDQILINEVTAEFPDLDAREAAALAKRSRPDMLAGLALLVLQSRLPAGTWQLWVLRAAIEVAVVIYKSGKK